MASEQWESGSPKIIAVMMHDVVRPDFERWLGERGLVLARFPESLQEGGDEEKFFVTLSSGRSREVFGGGEQE